MENAPLVKLATPHEVYLFDDQQPINNPKPGWLLIAKFNEPLCAQAYIEDYERRHDYAKGKLKMITKVRK